MTEKAEHVVTEGTIDEIRTKLAENKAVEQQENKEEVVIPEEKPGGQPEPTPAEPVVESFDRVKWLGETFETEVSNEEEFLSSLKDKNKRFDELSTEAQRYKSENEILKEGIDPMKFFANEKVFMYNEMLKKFPEYDPAIVSQIAFAELGEMSPMQVLMYQALLNDPKHEVYESNEEASADILAQWTEKGYNPELPLAEQDQSVKTALKRARKEAVDGFAKLKAEIKLPEKVDLTAKVAEKEKTEKERYDRLNPIVKNDIKRVEDSLKAIDFFETVKEGDKDKQVPLFSYNLLNYAESKKVKDVLSASIEQVSKTALNWDKSAADNVNEYLTESLLKDHLWEHRNQIMLAAKSQWRAEWEKESHRANHNPSDLNTSQKPSDVSSGKKEWLQQAEKDFDEMQGRRKK